MADAAGAQWGRLATYQLDVQSSLVRKWVRQGFLIPRLPQVYAIAGASHSVLADLTEAILYAGPDAMLAGLTAGWWVGAVRDRPRRITVSTPHKRRCRSIDVPSMWAFKGVDVRPRRKLEPIWLPQDGRVFGCERRIAPKMPVTPIDQLVRDLATELDFNRLRKALANLEYRRLIDMGTLAPAACARGRRGAANLKLAVARPLPQLARTKSDGEDDLLFVLEDNDVPLPDDTDTYIEGEEVDAVWYAAKLVVEIDGEGNHGTWSQGKRDRRKDMKLRELGYMVLRYTSEQLEADPARVAAEIQSFLISRAAMSA